ncbi:MAG: hypothetical protein KGH59_04400 [Candidatus Micrarchaeota archaeon]|nr:hypothetical protein [Candidatus Micrarchaeota archaeon]
MATNPTKIKSYQFDDSDRKFLDAYLGKIERGEVKKIPLTAEIASWLGKNHTHYAIKFADEREEFRGFAILSEIQNKMGTNRDGSYLAERRMIEILHNAGLGFEILEGQGDIAALTSLHKK